jgi:pyruvate formate lyase activating enzyme
LRRIGRFYEIDEVLDIVLRDRVYYQTSNGGVTLSGGEPTLFMDYASNLLREFKSSGIHTAIETGGFFEYPEFETKMLEWLDLVLFDVKLADASLHTKYTGRSNEVILQNLARLVRERPDDVIPRIPLIPDITTDPDNLRRIAEILMEMGVRHYWLLPYNPLGFSKREPIGKQPVNMPQRLLTAEEMAHIRGFFVDMDPVEM